MIYERHGETEKHQKGNIYWIYLFWNVENSRWEFVYM